MPNEPNGESRLDRIERGIEHLLQLSSKQADASAKHDQEIAELRDIAKRSLTMLEGVIQVSAENQAMLARHEGKIDKVLEAVKAAAESGRRTDERLNALIGFVAGWRIPPPPAPAV